MWDSGNSFTMLQFIETIGMPLDDDDLRLMQKVRDDKIIDVYDMHRLNVLCYMSIGFLKGKKNLLTFS